MQKGNGGIAVVDFPEKIGQEDEKSSGGAEPDFDVSELFARGRDEEPRSQAGTEKEHGMFVEEAESRDNAEQKPETRAAAVQNPQDNRGAEHPENWLERVHGEKVVEG